MGRSPDCLGTNSINADHVRFMGPSSRWVVLVVHLNTVALVVLNRKVAMLMRLRVVEVRNPFFGNCWPVTTKVVVHRLLVAHSRMEMLAIIRAPEEWFSSRRFIYDYDSLWLSCLLMYLFRQLLHLPKLFQLLQLSQLFLFLFLLR